MMKKNTVQIPFISLYNRLLFVYSQLDVLRSTMYSTVEKLDLLECVLFFIQSRF